MTKKISIRLFIFGLLYLSIYAVGRSVDDALRLQSEHETGVTEVRV